MGSAAGSKSRLHHRCYNNNTIRHGEVCFLRFIFVRVKQVGPPRRLGVSESSMENPLNPFFMRRSYPYAEFGSAKLRILSPQSSALL